MGLESTPKMARIINDASLVFEKQVTSGQEIKDVVEVVGRVRELLEVLQDAEKRFRICNIKLSKRATPGAYSGSGVRSIR